MKKLLIGCMAIVFAVGVGCMTERDKLVQKKKTATGRLVEYLGNEDISWNSDKFGLKPVLSGDIARRIYSRGKEANPYLLDALKDEKQFAAAHVLLTMINLEDYHRLSGRHWNHLLVRRGDTVDPYDKSQIPKLIEFWDQVKDIKKDVVIE